MLSARLFFPAFFTTFRVYWCLKRRCRRGRWPGKYGGGGPFAAGRTGLSASRRIWGYHKEQRRSWFGFTEREIKRESWTKQTPRSDLREMSTAISRRRTVDEMCGRSGCHSGTTLRGSTTENKGTVDSEDKRDYRRGLPGLFGRERAVICRHFSRKHIYSPAMAAPDFHSTTPA